MYINMLSDFLKNKYDEKFYRIALDGGMTCPNRDGRIGTRGCIFCSEKGSGDFTPKKELKLDLQIEKAKELVKDKSKSDRYIAYFQAFSNTYAPIDYLDKLYSEVIRRDDISILSIATRPDCINHEVLDLLRKLSKIKPVWVELGLQTSCEETATYIRRGYNNSVYESTCKALKEAGCTVITHLILGLPFEQKYQMINSAEYAGKFSDGIKFHMLYIIKNTDLAKEFKRHTFKLLERDEYIDILCECLRVIPKNVVIHRLTGDADKSQLIAPLWSADKKRVLREINNAFVDRDITQGENLKRLG